MTHKIKCANFRDGDFAKYKFVQVKRDGIYCRIAEHRAYTSLGTEITDRMPEGVLRALRYQPQCYGELYAPGCPASEVKSYLAASRGEELRFEAFATDNLAADFAGLHIVRYYFNSIGVAFVPTFHVSAFENLEHCWQWMLDFYKPDIEGLVFKNANREQWAKWKPVLTCDLICTGFVDGEGKHIGLIGSICGSTSDGRERATVGGMTDKERILISSNEDAFIGKVFEVAYQYVGSQGRLRHPRFIRWRDDKSAAECGEGQLVV